MTNHGSELLRDSQRELVAGQQLDAGRDFTHGLSQSQVNGQVQAFRRGNDPEEVSERRRRRGSGKSLYEVRLLREFRPRDEGAAAWPAQHKRPGAEPSSLPSTGVARNAKDRRVGLLEPAAQQNRQILDLSYDLRRDDVGKQPAALPLGPAGRPAFEALWK